MFRRSSFRLFPTKYYSIVRVKLCTNRPPLPFIPNQFGRSPMSDSGSSDDEWYARMEAEAAKQDDNIHTLADPSAHDKVGPSDHMSDDEYFTMIENHGSSVVDGSFRSEGDVVWQSMLRSVARGEAGTTKYTGLVVLHRDDYSSITLCQQWLFGFLPRSSKQYMEIDLFNTYPDENHMLFTDNVVHPSMVVSIWTKYPARRIEVSLFSPFTAQELAGTFPVLFDILDKIHKMSGLNDVVYCGTDQLLYESCIAHALPKCMEQWVENCGMFICERSSTHVDMVERSFVGSGTGSYTIDDLGDDDADLINNNWKYKSDSSIHLVRRMIKLGLCCGVRYITENSSELVAWFQTYPDGSCGMLFTMPAHRGKGLARRVVLAVLEKHARDVSRKCAPFVYIEQSNSASLALFTSLGFVKRNDVVWAGLQYTESLQK